MLIYTSSLSQRIVLCRRPVSVHQSGN